MQGKYFRHTAMLLIIAPFQFDETFLHSNVQLIQAIYCN